MSWWGWFFIATGTISYFLPTIGEIFFEREISFVLLDMMGENAIYFQGGSVALGLLMVFAGYFAGD